MSIKVNEKVTLKIDPDVYQKLQEVKLEHKDCKFNSDTIKMLITFYKRNRGRAI